MDSMRSLHSWLVVLSYLYLVESSSFSWIWSRRLSNLEQGWSGRCQNHTQSSPIGCATAGKRRAADVPAADQSGHGTEQGVRAKALIHLDIVDNQNKTQGNNNKYFRIVQSNAAHHPVSLLTAAVRHQPLLCLGEP